MNFDKQFVLLLVLILISALLTMLNQFDSETMKTIIIAIITYIVGYNQDNRKVVK